MSNAAPDSGQTPHVPDAIAVVGDLVGSRTLTDRVSVQRDLQRALRAEHTTPHHGGAVEAPHVTAGDEFQAIYPSWGPALAACYRLRLRLAGIVEIRVGLGRGSITVIDRENNIQDGSAWWAARAAIEEVQSRASRRPLEALRTGLASAPDMPPPPPLASSVVNLLDAQLHTLRPRSLRALEGLRQGRTQRAIAASEGVSASAISQLVQRDHLLVLSNAIESLAQLPSDVGGSL